MPRLSPTVLLGLACAAVLAASGAFGRGPAPVDARPVATIGPTASPTPVASGGLCTITGRQTVDAMRIERGRTVGLTLSIAADCPVQAQGRADIMLVVDISNSMMDYGKHEASKLAVAQFVDDVDFARHQVGLVLFNDSAYVAQPLTDRADRVTRAFDAAGRPSGGTNIAAAIRTADEEIALRGRPAAVSIIVLMTDGLSSEAPMAEAARESRRKGTVIFVIGLGEDAAQAVLRRLASSPEHFAYTPGPEGLAEIYARIAAMIRAFVVTDVWLYDRLGPDVTYAPGTGEPDEPQGAGELAWRRAFILTGATSLTYRVRIDRAGRVRPSGALWADYTDGDGLRRRFHFAPAEVEVVEPEVHTAYLPIAWRDACVPARAWADVVLALDTSSSMAGDKLAQAIAAAKVFLGLLARGGNQAAVVSYDEQARLVHPLSSDVASLEQAVDGLVFGRGTRLDRGIRAATEELTSSRHRAGNLPVIVLLSDGRQLDQPATARDWAEIARMQGIGLYTIALGADADRTMLRDLAGSPARTWYAPGPEDLVTIYDEVAGAVRCR
jgi:Mg-chelatase subunit ChlD